MITTDHAAEIAAAEARAAAAHAEVVDLRACLADEQVASRVVIHNEHDSDEVYEKPKPQTAEDTRAWIRAKYGRTRSEAAGITAPQGSRRRPGHIGRARPSRRPTALSASVVIGGL